MGTGVLVRRGEKLNNDMQRATKAVGNACGSGLVTEFGRAKNAWLCGTVRRNARNGRHGGQSAIWLVFC
jgi:hypothetical protein